MSTTDILTWTLQGILLAAVAIAMVGSLVLLIVTALDEWR